MTEGPLNARKAMFEALIHEITIVADDIRSPRLQTATHQRRQTVSPPQGQPQQPRPTPTRRFAHSQQWWSQQQEILSTMMVTT
jgi:hypothetical protein